MTNTEAIEQLMSMRKSNEFYIDFYKIRRCTTNTSVWENGVEAIDIAIDAIKELGDTRETTSNKRIERSVYETSILRRCLDVYGIANQRVQAMEECAELISALSHMGRLRTAEARAALIDELADARIMIDQMILAYDCMTEVSNRRADKLARQRMRMESST